MKEKLKKIGDCLWELPKTAKPGMKVPAWLFLSDKLFKQVEEGAIEQIANVAFLPGIYKHSIALPDMHFGYGFPIGGVAALDFEKGHEIHGRKEVKTMAAAQKTSMLHKIFKPLPMINKRDKILLLIMYGFLLFVLLLYFVHLILGSVLPFEEFKAIDRYLLYATNVCLLVSFACLSIMFVRVVRERVRCWVS